MHELVDKPPMVPNPVLLIEHRQMNDDNAARMVSLRTDDIQRCLGSNQKELSATFPEENMRESYGDLNFQHWRGSVSSPSIGAHACGSKLFNMDLKVFPKESRCDSVVKRVLSRASSIMDARP